MEWSLTVDVCAVNVYFVFFKQGNNIMNISVVDSMEEKVIAYLLNLAYHFITLIKSTSFSKGCDPNIRDAFGFSAAYWAKQNKHSHINEILPAALKVTKEEFYDHITTVWDKHGFKPTKKKGKKKGGKKKK